MRNVITLQRDVKQHQDVMALIEYHMPEYGTASNTVCVLLRHCPEYVAWRKRQRTKSKEEKVTGVPTPTESPDDSEATRG